jgi:hypothetical protein
VASLDVNRAYRVTPPWSSVGALRSRYVPVYRQLAIFKSELKYDRLRHGRWRDTLWRVGYGIVPVIVNWLNWKEIYRVAVMLRLIDFECSYESFEIDFDWLGRWRVSWQVGLCYQLGLSVLLLTSIGWTINTSCVSAIRRSQVRMISHSYVSRRVSGQLASRIRTKSSLLPLTSVQ